MGNFDFLKLDRDLRSTARRSRSFQRELRQGELPFDPYEAMRWVSTLETFSEVSAAPTDPVLTAARRWIYRLAEQRINHNTLVGLEYGYRGVPQAFDEPERNRLSLQQIFQQILLDDARRPGWVRTFTQTSREQSMQHQLLWERRREIAVRMQVENPASIEGCGIDILPLAEQWLEATQHIWEVFKKPRLSEYVSSTLGKQAHAGWPARLTLPALLDWFRTGHLFTSLALDPGPFPQALGASSYLRGMARLGASFVDATAPRDQPFVMTHDPYGLKRRTFGAFFGTLLATPAFLKHSLDLSPRTIRAHRQALSLTLLAYSRALAFAIVLRPLALSGPRALGHKIEDLAYDTLGFPLKLDAFGASFRLHVDDAQRFSGLLLGHRKLLQMIELHNDDFFRNPKAIDQLRSEAPRVPETETDVESLQEGARLLLRSLAEALD